MPTQAAKKAVKTGIRLVQGRLRPAYDGRPRLFILRDSVVKRDPQLERAKRPVGLVEEIPGTRSAAAAAIRAADLVLG